MRLTTAYAFRELNLYRISLTVFSYNTRAIRLYEKLGFVHEGVSRSALYRDGQRHDMLLMGLLRPEWEHIQSTSP
jgi:RimJ/RimL family protein N-acetyltransferase